MTSSGNVIVFGGTGALGGAVVDQFKENNYKVCNISKTQKEGVENILLDGKLAWIEQEKVLISEAQNIFGNEKVDAVICAAGGWAGGSVSSDDFTKNTEAMINASVRTSVLAARLASIILKPGGLLVLTGSAAALESTPGMIGYGLAKTAVHHLTRSLSSEGSGLPEGVNVVALLPTVLDTPLNRKFMPDADFSTWTPLSFISQLLIKWTTHFEYRPKSGSLLKLNTENGQTTLGEQ